jgi:signal transduction histidine kinase
MSNVKVRLQRLERILEISRELTSTVSLEPLLHQIVKVAAELSGSQAASILLLDARTGELRFRAADDDPAGQLRDIPVPVETSIAGSVLASGKPTVISDTHAEPRHYQVVGKRTGLETNSLLAVPLQIKNRCIGVLEAINKQEGGAFDQEDVEILTTLAAQAAVAIENAQLVGALRETYERLEELDQLKSNVIAIASHELRTPLGLILGYATLLQEQLGEAAKPQLDAVSRAALRLKYIIETMLNMRYLETGQVELSSTHFDLRAEIQEACNAYRTIAQAKELALETDLTDVETPILADREKMRIVLDNLISNAVKFTSSGGQVRVAMRRREDEVELTVTDTGIGIAPQELERIFDRFYQVEDHLTRRHEGLGLGLSTVKGLVELHGGRVWAESVLDRGSRFVVILPVSPP